MTQLHFVNNNNIRSATVDDIPQLRILFSELINDPIPSEKIIKKDLLDIIKNPNNHVIVVEHEGMIIGTCQTIIYRNILRSPCKKAIIDSVIIHSDYRGQGVGTVMIQYALDYINKLSVKKVVLVSTYKRYKSYKFYRKLGFNDSGIGFIFDISN